MSLILVMPRVIEDRPSLPDLEDLLVELPAGDDDDVRKRNLDLIRHLGSAPVLAHLLQSIISNPRDLALVASRSYRHVNHFDKLMLVDNGPASHYRLTLHLWEPPYSETELNAELIHDHRFSFWSAIVAGTLQSQNFVVRPGGANFRRYQYIPEKAGETTTANFYQFCGEEQLDETAPSKESVGEQYYLAYHRIHRVALPEDSMTCTLVLRGPRERNFSNVYNTAYPSTDTQLGNTMFTPAQIAERLGRIRDHVLDDAAPSSEADR